MAQKAQSYRDLIAWQKAIDCVEVIYQLTKRFPVEENFGLTAQIRRSATSIPANIAEGYGRLHSGDYLRFLSIARGSLFETETHLYLALRLGYCQSDMHDQILDQLQVVSRLIQGLIRSVKQSSTKLHEAPNSYDFDDNIDDSQ